MKIDASTGIREEIWSEVVHPAQRLEEQGELGPINSGEQPELTTDNVTKAADPVFVYMKALGSVSLLARDEEIEIAKGIEEGQKEVIGAVLSSPLAVKEIVQFGERLKSKRRSANDFQELEEDYFQQEEFNLPQILSLIERIKKQDERYRRVQKDLGRKKISKFNLIRLKKRLRSSKGKTVSLLEDLNGQTQYVENITQKLKRLAEEVKKAEEELREVRNRAGIPLGRVLDYRVRFCKSGMRKKERAEYDRVFQNVKDRISRVEAESGLSAEELKQVIQAIARVRQKSGLARKR